MIKPERTGETRLMVYVPAGSVLAPTTNSNGIFAVTALGSWAWALIPQPNRHVRVRTMVKYDFFIMSPCSNVFELFTIDNFTREVLVNKYLYERGHQVLLVTY